MPVTEDPHIPPSRPSVTGLLWSRPSARGRWAPALRAGVSFLVPALILLAGGLGQNAMLAALGTFAVLFGERRPYRIRWKTILTAGVLLVLTVTLFGLLGAWVGAAPSIPRELITVVALGALTAVSVFGSNALRLGPPGPFFLVLAGGVVAVICQAGLSPLTVVVCTAAGSASALIVSMVPALWRPHGPETDITEAALAEIDGFLAANRQPSRRHGVAASTLNAWTVLHDASQTDSDLARRLWESHHRIHDSESGALVAPLPRPSVIHRLRFALHPNSHASVTALRNTVAVLVVGSVSVLAGLGRPDWAVVSAVLVLQLGPDRVRGSVRGAHRVLGTLIGLAIFAALHSLDLHAVALIVVLAVLNMAIELTVTTNYALAATFITPLALLLGSPNQPIVHQMTSRVIETLLGVGIAIAMLWLLRPRAHRSTLLAADDRARAACLAVLASATELVPSTPEMRVRRRDLQWQLLEAELAATDSANDEPSWARDYWPQHAAARAVGYDTLSACWRAGPDTLVDPALVLKLHARAVATPDV
ncbi:FUSC family protein [Gordonia phthalatica]|uniref:Integral membrane bound transporter domain-containing protein n=1 Tax=Gordonia phthalatica TaxID=1136941 RepID=A0A0N9MZA5_9ACTN|nr:FUSC family protein [Gordonia phthalatica]ALG83418.1 hypothetical protein ACH46_01440 [Gordonia phthalatica]